MINYEVDPAILLPYLPAHTELDLEDGKCFLSLVGFRFENVKLKNIPIPLHRNFPEVNLRFYVKHFDGMIWKCGVVFISEIVPLIAITTVANLLYGEKYRTMPMKATRNTKQDSVVVEYRFKFRGNWQYLRVEAENKLLKLEKMKGAAFITNHFWGYSRRDDKSTTEYHVEHPEWEVYPVKEYDLHCDFEALYGKTFSFLGSAKPASVYLAKGSPIKIYGRKILR